VSRQKGEGQSQCSENGTREEAKGRKGTNAETLTPSKKLHEMNAWWAYISHKIDISKELDADFNFPKIHLSSHGAE
jgi:hypothetical protein